MNNAGKSFKLCSYFYVYFRYIVILVSIYLFLSQILHHKHDVHGLFQHITNVHS